MKDFTGKSKASGKKKPANRTGSSGNSHNPHIITIPSGTCIELTIDSKGKSHIKHVKP